MQALSRENLAGNAFRVLGLPSRAGQAEVYSAARRLRLWADPAQVPATPWDAPWLGSVPRTRIDIEQAVAQISDPVTRIRQRLFWFADADAVRQAPISRRRLFGLAASHGPPRYNRDPWITPDHDTSLARLAAALIADPEIKSPPRWGRALADFCQSVRLDAYREWFLVAEQAGDFEKRAGRDEIVAALFGVANSVVESLATRARDALDHDRADDCVELVGLLRSVPAEPDFILRAETGICDRIEDLLAARCPALQQDLFKNFNWKIGANQYGANRNRSKCRSASQHVKTSIDPLFAALASIGNGSTSNDPLNDRTEDPLKASIADRMKRLGLPAARALRNLGLAWHRVGQRKKAEETFLRAWRLTDDGEMIQKLKGDLADLTKKEVVASNGGRGAWIAVAVIVALGRLIAGLTGESHSNPSGVPYQPNYRELEREREMQDRQNQPWTMPPMPAPMPFSPPAVPGVDWQRILHPSTQPAGPGLGPFGPDTPASRLFPLPTTSPGDIHSLADYFRRPPTKPPPSNDGPAPDAPSTETTPPGGP